MSDVGYPISWASSRAGSKLSNAPRTIPYPFALASVAAVELLLVLIGSGFGPVVYAQLSPGRGGFSEPLMSVGIVAAICYAAIALAWRLYALPVLLNPLLHLRRIALAACLALLMLTAILFLLKVGSSYSRGAVSIFAGFMLACCCLLRLFASHALAMLVSRNKLGGRTVAIIGEADELADIYPRGLLVDFGLQERARYALPSALEDPAFAEGLRNALLAARDTGARELLLAVRVPDTQRLIAVTRELRASPLPARLLHHQTLRTILARRSGLPDPHFDLVDLQRAPLNRLELSIKRLLDVVGASLGLVLFAPLLLGASLAVRLDTPGPILFWQRRNGFNRQSFHICKFRTMTVLEDDGRVRQARRDDHRVTRSGRVLRKTSLDELPQLWNVLKGDMSLVGPRPRALAHDDLYAGLIGDYSLRHHVKPGITGWAQVNGYRGETAHNHQMAARIELDLWYINNWSILLDIQILARTMFEVFRHDAY